MTRSAMVIGFGSIGKRHSEILSAMNEIAHVTVFSSQPGLPYETLSSLNDIPHLNPDYVVIASPTNRHYPQLKFLEEHLEGKKILVEKPLFDSMANFKVLKNEVYVGYNLRFHPLINKIRTLCHGRKLWTIHVFCGSYLPDWRPDRDYRATSSARKDYGGGVLLDLSHELDYVHWLAGSINVEHAVSEKVSDLEIKSDDLLLMSGQTERGANVHVSLNYFTRKPIRQILMNGEGISIQGDLIENTLSVVEDGEASYFSWPDLERNDTYRAQHEAVLEGDLKNVCTFEEGLNTMRLIENIRAWCK